MITYLKSFEKHAFDRPCFNFKLYNNIFVPSSILFDVPSSKIGVVEVDFKLWNEVSSLSTSFPSWFC